jgi:hypothetical protein
MYLYVEHGTANYPEFEEDVLAAERLVWSPEIDKEMIGSGLSPSEMSREAQAIIERAWRAHKKALS